jgi:hypothetical protein
MKKQYKISTEFFSANVHPYAVYLGDGFYDEYPEIIEWASQQFGGDGWCETQNERWSYTFSYIWFANEIDRNWFLLKWS